VLQDGLAARLESDISGAPTAERENNNDTAAPAVNRNGFVAWVLYSKISPSPRFL
jgi:hypothetical protein